MDTTLVNAVCIAVVSFVMVQVCLAMPLQSDEMVEYSPVVEDTVYTESCVLCYAFQHAGACELCKFISSDDSMDVDEVMDKRSGNGYYHPFLRGGYPKKSYYYNPLLRGSNYKKSYVPKPKIYHPFLRGGFGNYNQRNYPSSG